MYQPLAPCPGCSRHVRVADNACPFCGTAFSSTLTAQPGLDGRRRLSRAALVTFAATLGAAGCGATVSTTDASSGSDTGVVVDRPAVVDSGATDAGTPDSGPRDSGTVVRDTGAPDDQGGVVAAYGLPFPTDAGPPDDEGNSSADYGSPPPRDAGPGPDDDGGSAAEYGGPPIDAGVFPLYGSPPLREDDAGF